ncbi:MAG TPA: PqiC family protein [Candidatus Binataceae bacterium]|nr:PqiC family protein [Candidatus Binataceae bacterium]
MARRIAHLMVPIALVAAAVSGCGTTAPSRFYTLDATAVSDGATPVSYPIMVGPVSVPAAVDRPQFVVQAAPNRVDIDEFNRWAAPLNDAIAQVVAGDLVKLLGTPNVAAAPMANFDPAYRVTIDVQRFDSVPGQAALLDAVWTVHRTAGGETRSGRTVAREAVQGDGFEALAAAHSRALAKMSGDIAAAIRAEAENKSGNTR